MVLKITKRCFSQIIVAASFDGKNVELSESEKVNLVALLQLLESAYDEDIWNQLGIVTFQNGGKCNFKLFVGNHIKIDLT